MSLITLRLGAMTWLGLAASVPHQKQGAHLEKRMIRSLAGLTDSLNSMSTSSSFSSMSEIAVSLPDSRFLVQKVDQSTDVLSKAAARRAEKEKKNALRRAQPPGQKMSRAQLKKAIAKVEYDSPIHDEALLEPVRSFEYIGPKLDDSPSWGDPNGQVPLPKDKNQPHTEDPAEILISTKLDIVEPAPVRRVMNGIERQYRCAVAGTALLIPRPNILRDLFNPLLSRGAFPKWRLQKYNIQPKDRRKECRELNELEHGVVYPDKIRSNAVRIFYAMKDSAPIFW